MKKTFLGLLILPVIFISLNAQAKPAKRYTSKSAIVEYAISGSQTGKETLYFENFGEKEARHSEMTVKVFGFTEKTQNLVLIDGDWMYTIDLKEKEGTKMNIATARDMAMKGMQNQALQNYGKETIKKMGGVKEGTEKVLGKTCQIYSFPKMNMKAWIYKSILLKSTMNYAGMQMDYIAQNFQENVAVPQDKLTIPSGIKITDAPQMPAGMKDFDMGNMFGGQGEAPQVDSQGLEGMEDVDQDIEEANKSIKKAFGLFKSMMD